jgi:hypothetical protein
VCVGRGQGASTLRTTVGHGLLFIKLIACHGQTLAQEGPESTTCRREQDAKLRPKGKRLRGDRRQGRHGCRDRQAPPRAARRRGLACILLTACHFHRPIVLLTVSDRRDMAYAPRDFPLHCCRSLRCVRWCATRAPCHQPSYPRTRGCRSWQATLGRFAAALAMIVLFNALDIQRQHSETTKKPLQMSGATDAQACAAAKQRLWRALSKGQKPSSLQRQGGHDKLWRTPTKLVSAR